MGKHSDSDVEYRRRKSRKSTKKRRSRSRSASSNGDDAAARGKSSRGKRRSRRRSRSRSAERSSKSKRRSSSSSRRSRDQRSRSSERRSRSHDRRSRMRERRSRSRDRRSRSRDRRSRSREQRSRSYDRRSRSRDQRSRSRDRRSRSKERQRKNVETKSSHRDARSRSSSPEDKDLNEDNVTMSRDPASEISGFDEMTRAEQNKVRMKLALQAAVAADEALKGRIGPQPLSAEEQMKRQMSIDDINKSDFTPSTFKSTRSDQVQPTSMAGLTGSNSMSSEHSHDKAMYGLGSSQSVIQPLASTLSSNKIVYQDTDNIAHESLYSNMEEREARWRQRLLQLRQLKLNGVMLT
ncbi:PREDICTED: serine/Arginine-related protein 53-like isoform X2 [Priapulus caudatus]|uniref:Serine/Arginine-related protein 53-like isoform X2 n=1 Tax=Priapulus caudatus TaxID=37621 RepID=A0ABM1E196_PRICU|nr:PREDICTED: serine/Arginine-related protein 53-like isoform X2 [Priapulus caudatus]